MATLTIELTQGTAARLEREALQRGMDVPTYVRFLLGDEDRGEVPSRDAGAGLAVGPQPASDVADDSWLDVPEAVVAAIRARGTVRSPIQEATADLAELLQTGGVDPGKAPADWDRRWAAYEARQNALDLADIEKTLRDMQRSLRDGSASRDRRCLRLPDAAAVPKQSAGMGALTAVVALRDGLTLLTTDDDFSAVPDRRRENWLRTTL